MIIFWTVTIDFTRGSSETHEWITDVYTRDGQLHLFKQNGDYAPKEHIGSFPLMHIKKWKRTER